MAALDVKKMLVATSCQEARCAWIDFLMNSNRTINRLQGYSRKTNQEDKYRKLMKEELWSSDITKYVRTARNVPEHGIEDTEIDDRFNVRWKYPGGLILGSVTVIAQNTETGEESYCAPSAPMEVYPGDIRERINFKPTVRLVSIVDPRGKIIRPPHVGVLQTDDEPECHAVARLYMQWVVDQISKFA